MPSKSIAIQSKITIFRGGHFLDFEKTLGRFDWDAMTSR